MSFKDRTVRVIGGAGHVGSVPTRRRPGAAAHDGAEQAGVFCVMRGGTRFGNDRVGLA